MLDAVILLFACQTQNEQPVCVPFARYRLEVPSVEDCRVAGSAMLADLEPIIPEGTTLVGACSEVEGTDA